MNTLKGENILKFNRMLKSVNGGKTYVRPLPSEEVVTIEGIHHVRPVVTKVLETVHQYVDVAAGYPSASSITPSSPSTSDMEAVIDGTTIDDNDGFTDVRRKRRHNKKSDQGSPVAQEASIPPANKRRLNDVTPSPTQDVTDKRPYIQSTPLNQGIPTTKKTKERTEPRFVVFLRGTTVKLTSRIPPPSNAR